MEKTTAGPEPRSRIVPFIAAVMGGAVIGLLVGQWAAPSAATAVVKLAETVSTQAHLSTSGPIIGAAIVGSCSILSAIAVPLVVMWAISRRKE